MPKWLSTATKSLRKREPEAREPFELRCVCGQVLTGERRATHQELACPTCSERLFALPCDVYPRLRVPAEPQRKTKTVATTTKSQPGERGVATSEDEPLVQVKAGKLRKRRRFRLSQLVTPFRLVILAVVLVLGGTGYWFYYSRSLAQAESTLRTAEESGIAALEAGDYEIAVREFESAVAALGVLKRRDPHAGWTHQMHRETAAISGLAIDSLYEIVVQAEERRGAVRAWTDYFRSTYAGDWVVFETTLPPAGNSSRLVIDGPFAIDGTSVQVVCDAGVLAQLAGMGESRTVIFAAQLKACRLDQATQQTWLIELEPASVFLWSDLSNYRALGFRVDDQHSDEHTAELLSRQTELLGIER
jgi:hypothetical protein